MRMKINLWEICDRPQFATLPPSQRNPVSLRDICKYQYQQVHIDDQPALCSAKPHKTKCYITANINITFILTAGLHYAGGKPPASAKPHKLNCLRLSLGAVLLPFPGAYPVSV